MKAQRDVVFEADNEKEKNQKTQPVNKMQRSGKHFKFCIRVLFYLLSPFCLMQYKSPLIKT